MRFEKFLLDNYIATEEGQKILHFFQNFYSYIDSGDKNGTVINFINNLLYAPIANDFFQFELSQESEDVEELEHLPFSEFEKIIKQSFEDVKEQWRCSYRELLSEIPNISVIDFFRFAPEYALPYLYPVHFNILQNIFEEFDISLPPIPGPRQYQKRCYYYIDICKSLYEFRRLHGMTPEELCVFLYGFSKKFIKSNIVEGLPKPSSAWIMGANYQKGINSDEIKEDTIISWKGNLSNVKCGDIIFTYEFAPKSSVTCCWRAITDGYSEPFWPYPATIWIGKPRKLPDITFSDFQSHSVFKEGVLVKTHMLHVGGGYSLKSFEYKAITSLLQQRNFDISILPELLSHDISPDVEINNERDVEIYLLEEFLEKVGVHSEKHIVRQMPLRMGRGICYYPDYVINAKTRRGEETGAFVWEAKYRITSDKQLLEDFYQARSYALRLNANGLGLVSYEGIWLSFADSQYSADKIQHYTWKDMQDSDTFSRIAAMLKKAFGKL